MRLPYLFTVLLVGLAVCGEARASAAGAGAAESGASAPPLRILRIGDSITRYAASDATLVRLRDRAGIRHEMVGSQNWPANGRDNFMEGYNGVPIQFFTSRQKQFGQPATPNADAVPLELALER